MADGWVADWNLMKIKALCGLSYKLRVARFSARLKLLDRPSVAIMIMVITK